LIKIKDFGCFAPLDLYDLYRDIYSFSEAMSETLEEKYPCLEDFSRDLADLGSQPGAIAIAAEAGECTGRRLAAFLTIRPRRQSRLQHTADMSMGVSSGFRGQGIGSLILQAGLKQASISGQTEIVYLMVRADNEPAIHLYRRMGFEELAALKRDTKIGEKYFDGLLMRRFLTASHSSPFPEHP